MIDVVSRILKLHLTHGVFSLRMGKDDTQTCYTDAEGDSRTAYAAPADLLEFADEVISRLRH
jgi:hypothetical protein